jgi:hypothetical protein
MSIGPVAALASAGEVQLAGANSRPRQAAPSPPPAQEQEVVQFDAGRTPEQAVSDAANVHRSPDLTQEEVQVERDSQIREQIIVRYMNQTTGNLILQVPSDQVLNVAHGIYQEFEEQVKAAESPAPPAPGTGESHGH